MDPTSPADEPAPELPLETPAELPVADSFPVAEPVPELSVEGAVAPLEPAPPVEGSGSPRDELVELAARAEKGRLSALDEERAAGALKACLLDGRAGVATALEFLPKFAWMVAVNGVTAAWPELTAGFRTQLFSGLSKDESDSARRLRLSLARGLFKLDLPAALKVAVAIGRDLRDKETGGLGLKEAQMFASVFIGRAKPWVAGLPLADLKPADADVLVQCALATAFTLPHPPVTQLGVLKWAAETGRLGKQSEAALEPVAKGVARWNGKWQAALRKEVPELPEAILAVLKEAPAPAEAAPRAEPLEGGGADEVAPAGDDEREDEDDQDERDEQDEGAPAAPRQYPVYVSKTVPTREGREPREPREPSEPREPAARESAAPARESARPAERGGRQSAANLNVTDALRQIEAHVAFLRGELKAAQNKLKDRSDDDRRPRRAERNVPIIHGEPTVEELARLNLQLEARIGELQQRVTDLTMDSEDRAASFRLSSDQPVTDAGAALCTLLGFKLQEDYEDFVALEKESIDIVVQAHYRTLLRHIFEVLTQEGVAFKPLEVPLTTR